MDRRAAGVVGRVEVERRTARRSHDLDAVLDVTDLGVGREPEANKERGRLAGQQVGGGQRAVIAAARRRAEPGGGEYGLGRRDGRRKRVVHQDRGVEVRRPFVLHRDLEGAGKARDGQDGRPDIAGRAAADRFLLDRQVGARPIRVALFTRDGGRSRRLVVGGIEVQVGTTRRLGDLGRVGQLADLLVPGERVGNDRIDPELHVLTGVQQLGGVVAGQRRPGLGTAPRRRRRHGRRHVDAEGILHLDRGVVVARSSVGHLHVEYAVPAAPTLQAIGGMRKFLQLQVGLGALGRPALAVGNAGGGEVVVVAGVVVAKAVRPIDAGAVVEPAQIVAAHRQLDSFIEVEAVAGEEGNRRIAAVIFGRADLAAAPIGLRGKGHGGARIVVGQPVVDVHRAPIDGRAGILDPDGEAAEPVAVTGKAGAGGGGLGQGEVEARRRHVAGRRHVGRNVAAVALLPDFDVADVALIGPVVVLAVIVGEIGRIGRVVLRAHQVAVIALQAVDDGRPSGR